MRKNIKGVLALSMAVFLSTSMLTPATPTLAKQSKNVVVGTQEELDAALSEKSVKKITVKTGKKTKLSIGKGTYAGKTLVIDAAKTTLQNGGKFKAVNIIDAKSYTEAAKANTVKVTDKKLTLKVAKSSSGSKISLAGKDATVKAKISGKVSSLTVKNATKLNLSGKSSVSTLGVETGDANITVGK